MWWGSSIFVGWKIVNNTSGNEKKLIELFQKRGHIFHGIQINFVTTNHQNLVNSLIEHCRNLVRIEIRFWHDEETTGGLGPVEFEKLARIRVSKYAKFGFVDIGSVEKLFYNEAKTVYDQVHPNGSEKVTFH